MPRMHLTSSWPFAVAIVALLLAIPQGWPSEFYALVRFIVSGVAAYGILQAFRAHRFGLVVLLLGIAVLFNPIQPIHFPKYYWGLLDLTAAALLGLFVVELQLGPNTEKAPYYRRVTMWLDQNMNNPSETHDVETRYERITDRVATGLGYVWFTCVLGYLIYGFGYMIYGLFDDYVLHWDDVAWSEWLLPPAFLLVTWLLYSSYSRD